MTFIRRKWYFFIPVLYVLIIVFLLVLQLLSRTFNGKIGSLEISGRYAAFPLFGTRAVAELTLTYNGIDLVFSRARPFTLAQSGGGSRMIPLDGWKLYSDGADISFDSLLVLKIRASARDGSSFSVSPAVQPADGPRLAGVISFRVRGVIRETQNTPVLSWNLKDSSYFLSLPIGSRIDFDRRLITFAIDTAGIASALHLGKADGSLNDPYALWLSQEASLIGREELQRSLVSFYDAAYAGWDQARFDPARVAWTLADGTSAFREEIGVCYLAESLPRGAYLKNRQVYMQELGARVDADPSAPYTLSASPFAGRLAEYFRRLQAREQVEIARIRGFVQKSDRSLFGISDLIPYALDHGPFSLVQEIFGLMMSTADARDNEPYASLGLLEAIIDYYELVGEKDACLARGKFLIESLLLPSIRKTDQGIFLEGGEAGTIDVLKSATCGVLLVRAGESLSLPLASSIGRTLTASVLGLMNEMGFLPASLRITSNGISSREGTVTPETVYPLIAGDRRFPREIPLQGVIGPGAWIWTAAKPIAFEDTTTTVRAVLSFPIGAPHYLIIQGLKPFTEIRMHGTVWRSDPDYAQYSDGWMYDGKTQTLFMKITGAQDPEEILITY